MPDLSEMLSGLLSSPEAQKNLQGLFSSLQAMSGEEQAALGQSLVNAMGLPAGEGEPSAPQAPVESAPPPRAPENTLGEDRAPTGNAGGAPGGGMDLSALASLLGGMGNTGNSPGNLGGPGFGGTEAPPGFPPIDMKALLAVQRLFSRMNREDKNVALLRALRPHLREPGRVDEAIRLLQLLTVLPELRASGLFGGGGSI